MVVREVGILTFLLSGSLLCGAPVDITLLHTNDIHGHISSWTAWEGALKGQQVGGFDRLATAIKTVRMEAGKDRVLLLDAGDTIADTAVADLTSGAAVVLLMNHLGYDGMALGNHEFDFGVAALKAREKAAKFPFLAANVLGRSTGKELFRPYFVREVAGVKVGIIGVGYPNTPLTTSRANVEGLQFSPIVETIRKLLPVVRAAGAEAVIVLSHYGLSADRQLAEAVPGIDVIIGGHSHNRVEQPLISGSTIIVQAGAHGSDLGRLDLRIERGKIVSHRGMLLSLAHDKVAADEETARLIKSTLSPHRQGLEERVGEADGPLIRAQTIAGSEPRKRTEESPADSLFADLIREATKSEIAFLPGVGYGVAIPPGPISVSGLRNLIPHHSKVVTLSLTGRQIKSVIEQSIENSLTEDPETKVGGMVQASGIRFCYDSSQEAGSRARDILVSGAPLEENRQYRVATNAMLAGGGHRYISFVQGRNRVEVAEQYAMIRRAIQQGRTVKTPEGGRITECKSAR